DAVALVAQRAGAEEANRVLVLDEEHGAGAGEVARRGAAFGELVARREQRLARLVARQVDGEGGAPPRRAVDEDEAAGLLDDAVDGGKAEPGAGSHLLRREEGLED